MMSGECVSAVCVFRTQTSGADQCMDEVFFRRSAAVSQAIDRWRLKLSTSTRATTPGSGIPDGTATPYSRAST